jgi:hypothetical protein
MKVRLKGRFATPEDTANALGMSAPRLKRLVGLANNGHVVANMKATTLWKALRAVGTPIHKNKNGLGSAPVRAEAAKTAHEASSQKRKSSKKIRVSGRGRSRGKASKAR